MRLKKNRLKLVASVLVSTLIFSQSVAYAAEVNGENLNDSVNQNIIMPDNQEYIGEGATGNNPRPSDFVLQNSDSWTENILPETDFKTENFLPESGTLPEQESLPEQDSDLENTSDSVILSLSTTSDASGHQLTDTISESVTLTLSGSEINYDADILLLFLIIRILVFM